MNQVLRSVFLPLILNLEFLSLSKRKWTKIGDATDCLRGTYLRHSGEMTTLLLNHVNQGALGAQHIRDPQRLTSLGLHKQQRDGSLALLCLDGFSGEYKRGGDGRGGTVILIMFL